MGRRKRNTERKIDNLSTTMKKRKTAVTSERPNDETFGNSSLVEEEHSRSHRFSVPTISPEEPAAHGAGQTEENATCSDNGTEAYNGDAVLEGRRIVSAGALVVGIGALAEHGSKCSVPTFLHEQRKGLKTSFRFFCHQCAATFDVGREEDDSLNEMSVYAASCTGNGFSNTKTQMALLDIPFMSFKDYKKMEAEMTETVERTLLAEMLRAGEEERRLAVEAGDVLPDGTPWITVVVDGSWGTRSHGHKYSSLGGMAAIIGLRTKKLLFYGVKNKFCMMCARHQGTSPPHKCYKNWSGTSTAMETHIIVEGCNRSEDMHGVRYMEIIGDGDSSVYKNILSYVTYGRDVKKIECANHVTKCFTSSLYEIAKRLPECKAILSRARITRMKICVRKMIKHRAQQSMSGECTRDTSAKLLTADVKNAAFHALGHHEKCDAYYCNVVQSASVYNAPRVDIPAKLRAALMKSAEIVCAKSRSLVVYDATSNLAECLMSQVAKMLGGKRVNHYQRDGYSRRCANACLWFQRGADMHMSVYRRKFGRNPPKILKCHVQSTLRRNTLRNSKPLQRKGRYQKRKPAQPDRDYGPQCQVPDLKEIDPSLYQQKVNDFRAGLDGDRQHIAKATASDQDTWMEERRRRITATTFHAIANMKPNTPCGNIVNRLLYDCHGTLNTPAIQYGKVNEELAIQHYEHARDVVVVRPVGLLVHPTMPFLPATPDGRVDEDLIVEVKCPKRAEETTLSELVNGPKKMAFFLDEQLHLKKQHQYYTQVQCQMACSGAKHCDFVVWSPQECVIDRIEYDATFIARKVSKVRDFYEECIVPEIVDPRKCRSMPFRERSAFGKKK